MGNGSGVSRGDRNRNARLERLRASRGKPSAALRHPGELGAHHGQPRPSSHQPDHALQGPAR